MKTGIYKIENQVNGHVYVGQSVDIKKRWNAHKESAFCSTSNSYDYPLSRAFRKYGIDNFSFEIQEECNLDLLNERERYYIQEYNSFFNGYNQTQGGDSRTGGCPKEHVIGIIHDLETTNMLHKEIAEKWNISVEMVQGINTGRYWNHNRKYPIQDRYGYIEKVNKIRHIGVGKLKCNYCCIDCGNKVSYKGTRCRLCDNKRRISEKPINREALKEMIRHIPFVKIGESFGVTDNAIRKWCKGYALPFQKKEIIKYTEEEWALI